MLSFPKPYSQRVNCLKSPPSSRPPHQSHLASGDGRTQCSSLPSPPFSSTASSCPWHHRHHCHPWEFWSSDLQIEGSEGGFLKWRQHLKGGEPWTWVVKFGHFFSEMDGMVLTASTKLGHTAWIILLGAGLSRAVLDVNLATWSWKSRLSKRGLRELSFIV